MTSTLKAYALRLFPQLAALAVILLMVSIAFPGFFRLEMQNGRLYGSVIDILNRPDYATTSFDTDYIVTSSTSYLGRYGYLRVAYTF